MSEICKKYNFPFVNGFGLFFTRRITIYESFTKRMFSLDRKKISPEFPGFFVDNVDNSVYKSVFLIKSGKERVDKKCGKFRVVHVEKWTRRGERDFFVQVV